MKNERQVKDLWNFIGYFNDGSFMNQDYRRGIMDALSFVLYKGEKLETIMSYRGQKSEKVKYTKKRN